MTLLNCNHFPACGGCQVLHMAPNDYTTLKQNSVLNAFQRQGLDISISSFIQLGAGIRRRATLKLRGGSIGFYESKSHRLVSLTACPILLPSLSHLLPKLRLLSKWFPKGADVELTHSDTGIDINCTMPIAPVFSLKDIESLTCFIQDQGWARFSVNGIVFIQNCLPQVIIDAVPVTLRPGCFLQASSAMEEALKNLIFKAIPSFSRALDLFCGRGTLSLPLSTLGPVDAYELDAGAVTDLMQTVHTHKRPVTAKVRDLFKDPLQEKALNPYDWIVLNPPRAGAAAQVKALAQVQAKILYVSCCAETLAQDCKILVKAGRTLRNVTVIDAFFGSKHVETVVEIH